MKIIHICLAASYTDGLKYQDNMLAEQNARDGHEVTVISNCDHYVDGVLTKTVPCDILLECNVRLIRASFLPLFGKKLSRRLKYVKGLSEIICSIQPDVIFYHGFVGVGIFTVIQYKKANPTVRLVFDSHADVHNASNSFISDVVLHRGIYGAIARYASKWADSIYYVSMECKDFLIDRYRINDSKLTYLPLGGIVRDMTKKKCARLSIEARYGLCSDDVILFHSGKLNSQKKTDELVAAFERVGGKNQKLFIVGKIEESLSEIKTRVALNSNIYYVGWRVGDEFEELLLAADVYLQPGTQSATLQHAICCGCIVCIFPYESHSIYLDGNGFYVKNAADIASVLNLIERNEINLTAMKEASFSLGRSILDYEKLARLFVS
ncbi:glycosyltransferase family 4 protein [Variovorax paradoxus]|uniref:glycosyltransferase family 4 protein n=1 Tax=Variovorax paradoxus TaxID=34073 RepID=UPI0012BD0C8E|nr:glycosyltransferase family 4 protein [Variovorax paradoxus]